MSISKFNAERYYDPTAYAALTAIEKEEKALRAYRNYCTETNEYVRSTADFYTALEGAGFDRVKVKNKRFIKGVRLKPDDAEGEDFLS